VVGSIWVRKLRMASPSSASVMPPLACPALEKPYPGFGPEAHRKS
jgi:hypothetical protein